MGVKSTRTLTRDEAVKKYVDLKMEDDKLRRQFQAEAILMGTVELENELERLNDAARGGEGFENYSIDN